MVSESLKQAYIKIINEELNTEINPDDIDVVRGNDLYFPKGNEHGALYEPLYIATHEASKRRFHGRTPTEAKNNLLAHHYNNQQ